MIAQLAIHPWHQRFTALTQRLIVGGISLIIVLMPFHAAWVVIAGTAWGQPSLVAIWKELVLIGLLGLAGMQIVVQRGYSKLNRLDTWLVLGICVSGLISSLISRQFGLAFLAGVKTTLLPLLAFLLAQIVSHRFQDRRLAWLLLLPAILISGVAIWQFVAIPTSLLSALGYSADTITPVQGVHPGFDFYRSFATLGGPNQLGTYLIMPATIFLAYAINAKNRWLRIIASVGYSAIVISSVVTFSRSALLGLVVASLMTAIISAPKRWRWWLVAVTIMLLAVLGLTVALITTQNSTSSIGRFLVRGDITDTGLQGGDTGHIDAVREGWKLVKAHPLGLGLGSAGPASFFGQRAIITENWYLQIALETGWLGLVAMIALFGHIVLETKRLRAHSPLHIALIAALAGLAIASFFLHTLADSTLAYITLITAGLLVGRRGHHA